MKQVFVCLVHYLKPLEEVSARLEEHRAYLRQGYERGILLASGPRTPKDGGIIIGLFESKAQAVAFSESDPYTLHNLARYEIYEFEPVLHAEALREVLNS